MSVCGLVDVEHLISYREGSDSKNEYACPGHTVGQGLMAQSPSLLRLALLWPECPVPCLVPRTIDGQGCWVS